MERLQARVLGMGGWSDAVTLYACLTGGAWTEAPASPVVLPAPGGGPVGQAGILLREALLRQDARAMAACIPVLDEAHRVELLLGAALRDGRQDHLIARLYMVLAASDLPMEVRFWPVCRLLCEGEPDTAFDDLASAYVAERRVPDRWVPEGAPAPSRLLGAPTDVAVADAYAAGVGGLALLDIFVGHPLYAAVAHYYRVGTIHALGPRPLLILAACA